jgi:competence protein ComEA
MEMPMDDPLKRYRPYLAMSFLFLIVLLGTIFVLRRPEPVAMTIITPTPRPTPTLAMVLVDVRGAVAKPGVYSLPSGSRVQDALALAGDVSNGAETRGINLARKLNDGEQLYIPTASEATAAPLATTSKGDKAPTPTKTPLGKINLNTATIEQLDVLPGIGPAIAERIVEYRTQNGGFKQVEDLKKVRGIGDVLFNQVKDFITVN